MTSDPFAPAGPFPPRGLRGCVIYNPDRDDWIDAEGSILVDVDRLRALGLNFYDGDDRAHIALEDMGVPLTSLLATRPEKPQPIKPAHLLPFESPEEP